MDFSINNKAQVFCYNSTGFELKSWLDKQLSLRSNEYYLIFNGKLINDESIINHGPVHIIPRVNGGKGGFGSMLRAIGAQIEKTTNREACRDLSGRRLRDINEEKRLKNWINQQAEREKEAKERKQKKLERLCEKPKHEFKDEEYDKKRSVLPEIVEDAVLQGLQASCSSKRKTTDQQETVRKKKPKLWVDSDLDDDISSDDEQSDSEELTNTMHKTNSSDSSEPKCSDIPETQKKAENKLFVNGDDNQVKTQGEDDVKVTDNGLKTMSEK